MTPPPATISGRFAALIALDGLARATPASGGPRHVPDAPREKLLRPVVRLGLHVLRERERHGPRLGRVGEHAHRRQRGGQQLLGRSMRSKYRDTGSSESLTETSPRDGTSSCCSTGSGAGCEDVAGQQQHGQPVDGRERRAGHHVRRAGADRGRARECCEPVLHPREPDGGVHHRLLVPRLVVGQQIGVLVQRLADPGDVAVAEDPEAPLEEPVLDAVALDVLRGEEPYERL